MGSYKPLFALLFCSLWLLSPLQELSVHAQNSSSADNGQIMTFSLEEAQLYAVEHNINAENARLSVEEAKGQVTETKSIGLPQIDGTIGYTYNLKIPAQLVEGLVMPGEFTKLVFGTDHNINLGLSGSQLLFDGSYLLGLKAAEMFVERSRQENMSTEIGIKNAVASAYFATLVVDEQIELLDKNKAILDKILFETSQLYENGFVEELEVDRLRLSLANLETQKASATRQGETATNFLKFQMGLDMMQAIKLTDTLEDFISDAKDDVSADVMGVIDEAMKNRVEMRLLKTQNIFRDLDIRQVKAQYLPNVVAFIQGQAAYQGNNLKVWETDFWIPSAAVGVQVNVPIFDGFKKRGQLQQRYITQQKAFNQEALMKQSIHLQVLQAQTSYISAYQQLNQQQESLELAEKIYNVSLIKYKEGLGSSIEVNSAESSLYETQGLFLTALYELVQAKLALNEATGRY